MKRTNKVGTYLLPLLSTDSLSSRWHCCCTKQKNLADKVSALRHLYHAQWYFYFACFQKTWEKYGSICINIIFFLQSPTYKLLIIVKEVSYVNSFHPTLTNIPKTENLRKDPIGEIVSLHSCFHNTDCIRF